MTLLVAGVGLSPASANMLAVAAMSAVNFVIADRWVFRRHTGGRITAVVVCIACVLSPHRVAAQTRDTIVAWDRYVEQVETDLVRGRQDPGARTSSRVASAAAGESVQVPGGTISDWHGSVFIRELTVDRLLHRLQHPGTPPPQDDVVSSRVLGRTAASLRVAIRLSRTAIVTVTYDTEHQMEFRRWTAGLATARSVATRIEEVGGTDHGFLWRLHSYWTYEQVDRGVLVSLRSLTLSRGLPALARPIASPLVTRIARESTTRTLAALERFFDTPDGSGDQDAARGVSAQTRYSATASCAGAAGSIGVPCDRTKSW